MLTKCSLPSKFWPFFLLGIAFLLPSVLVLTYVPTTIYYTTTTITTTPHVLDTYISARFFLFSLFTSSTSFLRHNLPAFPPRPQLISARPVQSSIYFSFSFFFFPAISVFSPYYESPNVCTSLPEASDLGRQGEGGGGSCGLERSLLMHRYLRERE